VQPMSSLGFASAPQFYTPEETPPPDAPEPPAEDLASTPAHSEPDGGGTEGDMGATSADPLPAPRLSPGWPPPYQLAVSNALWKQNWRCCFGAFRSICAGAWCVFLTIPLVFFTMALPGLQARVSLDITTFGLVLFGLTGICFLATTCHDPGVPPAPESKGHETYLHPGNEYTFSRDTSRYVKGFDHFCEFVGNDIGRGNLPCFVAFLVLLSTLSTFVVVTSSWEIVLMWLPPAPVYHIYHDVWRLVLAGFLVVLILWGLVKCWTSETCSGVGPLIMLMPGAHVGAGLILLVITITILLPFTSNIMDDPSPAQNPAAFFLILPCLALAVLFWGMSAHWVKLLCDGISQKVWLRAQGYRKPRKPTTPTAGTTLV